MRCQRTMMSISVWSSMCPMCSAPVTLGGGSSMVNVLGCPTLVSLGGACPEAERGGGTGWGFFASVCGGVLTENNFSLTQYCAQRCSMALGSYALDNSWGMGFSETESSK